MGTKKFTRSDRFQLQDESDDHASISKRNFSTGTEDGPAILCASYTSCRIVWRILPGVKWLNKAAKKWRCILCNDYTKERVRAAMFGST